MILSYAQIEEIAVAVILDFTAYLANSYTKPKSTGICATPIERLAKEYLGLTIAYVPLPSKYDFCGLTAYVDTEYKYEEDGQIRTIPMKQNQILLNTSFLKCGPASKLKGKHRFTIAHESAHQLLYQMEDDAVKTACKQKYRKEQKRAAKRAKRQSVAYVLNLIESLQVQDQMVCAM